jgi:hypothetical protein
MRSRAAALARSRAEAEGMQTCDGNQARESAMRSAVVDQIHTR